MAAIRLMDTGDMSPGDLRSSRMGDARKTKSFLWDWVSLERSIASIPKCESMSLIG